MKYFTKRILYYGAFSPIIVANIMLRSSIICYIIRGRRPLMKGPMELIISKYYGPQAHNIAALNP